MSSSQPSPLSGQLDRVLAEHRAGHFGKARLLLAELEQNRIWQNPEESHRIAELRERFRPDWFAWLCCWAACCYLPRLWQRPGADGFAAFLGSGRRFLSSCEQMGVIAKEPQLKRDPGTDHRSKQRSALLGFASCITSRGSLRSDDSAP